MPVISMFYGIIQMFFNEHSPPHFHAQYQDFKAMFDLEGNLMNGNMPNKQMRLIAAWAEIHYDELVANWELAKINALVKIDPLR